MELNKLRASTPASRPNQAEMDLRGYGLPLHSGYSAYPRVRSLDREPGPRSRYEFEREYSICDLSLTDDQTPEDMPYWTRSTKSSKKQGSKGSNGRGSETKHHEPKKPLPASRNQNPGIDIALRSLTHEVNASIKTFQALVQCFEVDVESLRDWAEDDTLDTVWRNKVKDKCREKRDKQRFEGATGRIADARATIKCAVKNAKALKESWHNKYEIERQMRTAKKTLLYCDGIIDLAERAASERLACKQLVSELEEARCLLDRKKHPWIYGEDMEQSASDLKQPKSASKKKGEKVRRNETDWTNHKSDQEDDAGAERQEDPGDSFDNPPDQPQEDAGDNQGAGGW